MLLFFWNYFKILCKIVKKLQWTGIILLDCQDCSINLTFNNETVLHMYYQFQSGYILACCCQTQMWHSCDAEPSCSTQLRFLQDPASRSLGPDRQLFLFSFANERCVTRCKKGSHRMVINIQRTKLAWDLVFWAKIRAYFRKIFKEGSLLMSLILSESWYNLQSIRL